MKILIRTQKKTLCLYVPTFLLCSKGLILLGLRIGKKYDPEHVPDLKPEAVGALCREMKRIKKKHGSWELLDLESSDGDHVQILL